MTFEEFWKSNRDRYEKLSKTNLMLAINTAAEEAWEFTKIGTRFAEGFKKGQESVKRRNKSGCCCIIDDDDSVVSVCGAHADWIVKQGMDSFKKLLERMKCREHTPEERQAYSAFIDSFFEEVETPGGTGGRSEMNLPSWIAIKDEQPEHGQIVITYHDETGIDVMKCHILLNDEYGGNIMFTSCLGFLTDDVSHWIPIGKTMQKKLKKCGYA